MTSSAAFGQHLLKFKKRPKMQHPTTLFALSLMQCQMGSYISRVKNIGNVFELSGVVFRLAPPYGGFLVHIHKRKLLTIGLGLFPVK